MENIDLRWQFTVFGDAEGLRLNSRFHQVEHLIQREQLIYITDLINRKIKQLNMTSGLIATLHQSQTHRLYYMAAGKSDNEFYVTAPHGVLHIQDSRESWLVGGPSSNPVATNGQFSAVGFNNPRGIHRLDDGTLLVANTPTGTLNVIDLDLQEIRVICIGKRTKHIYFFLSRLLN